MLRYDVAPLARMPPRHDSAARSTQRLARLATALVLTSAAPAVAAEPVPTDSVATDPPPSAPTHVYVVTPPGTDPGLREVLDTARANLHAQGIDLVQVEPTPGQNAAARARSLVSSGLARGAFWIDERRPGQLRVFLVDPVGTTYVRRIPVEPTSPETSREAVWHIVESGSRALAAGEVVGMEEARAEDLEAQPKPQPEPTPPPTDPTLTTAPVQPQPEWPPPRHVFFGVALSYLGSSLATPIPWSSGAALDLTADYRGHWRFTAGYGLLLPWRGGDPVVTWRHRAELRTGPRAAFGSRVELLLLAGGAMEALRWRSTTGDDGGWRPTALATVDGGLGIRLVANLWLVAEAGMEVLLNRFDFVECEARASRCEGAARREVLTPWRVRPRARLGLAARF